MKSTESSRATNAGQASWTRDLARDLFCGRTTPFAWTLLRSPAETALRSAYTELGAPPTASSELFWRVDDGAVWLNAALVARADHALAGAAWLGRVQPSAPDGLLARLQTGSTVKRCQARIAATPGEVNGLQTRLAAWLTSVQRLKWTQADLLQVMEELEPHARAALQLYFLARMGLNASHAHLQARLAEWIPDCSSDILASLYLGVDDLPSAVMAQVVHDAARLPAADPARSTLIARWSHRGPGEIRPDAHRWGASPELLSHLAGQGEAGWRPGRAAEQRMAAVSEIRGRLDGGRIRQLDELLQQAHRMIAAADVAWDALTMIMAAAQRWTAAAAREATAAGLIAGPGDVLYLELEELKQVATGEWHAGRSAGVREAVEGRKRAPAKLPPSVGEGGPVTVSPGACDGPLYGDSPVDVLPPPNAVWFGQSADPGCAPFWRHASAVLATGDDIWTPGMIAARGVGVPARVVGAAVP